MNERILELAHQAGLKVESWMTNPPKPFQILGSTEQFELFAELIIRECAQIADDGYGSDHFGNGIAGYQLLKHFGVEE